MQAGLPAEPVFIQERRLDTACIGGIDDVFQTFQWAG